MEKFIEEVNEFIKWVNFEIEKDGFPCNDERACKDCKRIMAAMKKHLIKLNKQALKLLRGKEVVR